jgi:tRNA modification GTPase
MSANDTIFAVSSGSGRAAIAVIRLSGPRAREIVSDMTGGMPQPRHYSLRRLVDPGTGEVLDEAIAVWLPAPRSFTGENCAEFHVHASRAVLAAIFKVFSGYQGVRPAEAGEFTRRAVRHGKMDLVEAEGLGDLLGAQTEFQRRQAMSHMLGDASSVFDSWRERLLQIRADIEAVIDFADEEGVAEAASLRINSQTIELLREMEGAVAKSAAAGAIRDGVKVVLAGPPNTGKSSLLNAIARRDAAIVSAIPGTTRDVIEVMLDMGGIPVILTDTAGLRSSGDEIEQEGINRSLREVASADIVVWVASPDVEGSDRCELSESPDLIILGKSDLVAQQSRLPRNELRRVIPVSAATGQGLPEFVASLTDLVRQRLDVGENPIVVSERQRKATLDSIRILNDSLAHNLSGLEMKAEDIRKSAEAIGRITGRTEVEEWLGAIFSKFCIGK